MLELHTIDVLTGLRTALAASEVQQVPLFTAGVMEPLRAFWEPWQGFRPGGTVSSTSDPMLQTAHQFGFYSPLNDAAVGLAALDQLTDALAECESALQAAWTALAPAEQSITLRQIAFTLVLADPAVVRDPHYTGVGNTPGQVLVALWPTEYNLPRLGATAAHELHHNVRFNYEPFVFGQTTLGQYLVAEGLAEAFAAEVCGVERLGPWAFALDAATLEAVTPRYAAAVATTDFNVMRGYIFGDDMADEFAYAAQGLPAFAGYTVGYALVQAFLARSGMSAAAATYLPWREIVDGSGFFAQAAS